MRSNTNIKLFIIVIVTIILVVLEIIIGFIGIQQKPKEIDKIKPQNAYALQEVKNQSSLNTEILSFDNCDYKYTSDGGIILREYTGNVECIIVPKEINGFEIEYLNKDVFDNNDSLEEILIHTSIDKKIKEINNFKRNDNELNNEYIKYTTTKKYNDAYLYYIKLSDEEKSKYSVIPPKFIISPEQLYLTETNNSYQAVGMKSDNLPTSYDLRKYININVENQGKFGTCYAYATLELIESYLAKILKETKNFSEIHLALLSKQGYGGNTEVSYKEYLATGYGPIDEDTWNSDVDSNKYDLSTIINYCKGIYISDNEIESIIKEVKTYGSIPEYYTFGAKQITSLYGDYKKINSDEVTEIYRNLIKKHIMNNGAVAVLITDPDKYATMYGKNMVMNTKTSVDSSYKDWHEVTIIGWDDNFSATNFPESMGVTSDGAYLALNSWGNKWGNNRIFLDIIRGLLC